MRQRWTWRAARIGWLVALSLCGMRSAAASDVPHGDYQLVVKSATATSTQSDTALWTPTSGNYFILQACFFSTDFPVQFDVEVSDVDVFAPVNLESYGNYLLQLGGRPLYVSAKDAVLRYSTSSAGLGLFVASTSITCWGYEERQ